MPTSTPTPTPDVAATAVDFQSIFSYIGIGLSVFCLLIAVIGILGGIKRGWMFTLIRLGVCIVSFGGAFLLSGILLKGATLQLGPQLEQQIASSGFLAKLPREEIEPLLLTFLSAIIRPLIFGILYFLLDCVLHLVFHIVTAGKRKKAKLQGKKPNLLSRLLGAGIGAVTAVFACVCLLQPMITVYNVYGSAQPAFAEQAGEELDPEAPEPLVLPEVSVPVLNVLGGVGGNLLSDGLSTLRTETKTLPLDDEVTALAAVVHQAQTLKSNFSAYGPKDIEKMTTLFTLSKDSALLPALLGTVIPTASKEVIDENTIFGGPMPEFPEAIDPFLKDVFRVLKTSDEAVVLDDLIQLTKVLGVLVKYEIVGSGSSADTTTDKLTNPEFLPEMNALLVSYDRFKPLAESMNGILLRLLSQNVDVEAIDKANPELLDNAANVLNGIRTEDCTAEDLKKEVNSMIEASGTDLGDVNLDPIIDQVSEALLHELKDKEEITGDDLRNLLNDFATSGKLPEGMPDLPDSIPGFNG